MADPPAPVPQPAPDLRARLQAIARLLRQSDSLDAESQQALAELVEELSKTLHAEIVPPAEVAQLAESTAHLAEALHHRQDRGLLGAARDRLERAAVNAEANAPFVVGLARRVLDMLASIGI